MRTQLEVAVPRADEHLLAVRPRVRHGRVPIAEVCRQRKRHGVFEQERGRGHAAVETGDAGARGPGQARVGPGGGGAGEDAEGGGGAGAEGVEDEGDVVEGRGVGDGLVDAWERGEAAKVGLLGEVGVDGGWGGGGRAGDGGVVAGGFGFARGRGEEERVEENGGARAVVKVAAVVGAEDAGEVAFPGLGGFDEGGRAERGGLGGGGRGRGFEVEELAEAVEFAHDGDGCGWEMGWMPDDLPSWGEVARCRGGNSGRNPRTATGSQCVNCVECADKEESKTFNPWSLMER